LKLIIVLLYVDNPNAEDAARTLSILSCRFNFTLLVAFNLQEAASHIETFKRYANKGPETLKGKFDETDRVTKLLTIASGFNSSDSASLLRQTGSLAQIAQTNKAEIACISGIGTKDLKTATRAKRASWATRATRDEYFLRKEVSY